MPSYFLVVRFPSGTSEYPEISPNLVLPFFETPDKATAETLAEHFGQVHAAFHPNDATPPVFETHDAARLHRTSILGFRQSIARLRQAIIGVRQTGMKSREVYYLPDVDELTLWLAGLRMEAEEKARLLQDKPAAERDTESAPVAGAERPAGLQEQDDKLPPSRTKALAAYEYALSVIPGADKMTISELFDALRERLDVEITKGSGPEAEKLAEFRNSLPDNATTFGKYLRDAGVKRYNTKGDRLPTRSIRRRSEI